MTVARSRRGAARASLATALVAAFAGTLAACTTTFTTARPAEYTADFNSASGASGASGAASLFATDAALLGDARAATLTSPADSTAVPLALTPATFEYTQEDLPEHERVGRRASF